MLQNVHKDIVKVTYESITSEEIRSLYMIYLSKLN